jgi:mannosyltransferase OCH1-like enzyme
LSTNATPIPRVLHQIWLGKGEMPLHQRRWRRRFAEMNPHWEMRLWTDDNLPPILNRNAWAACGNVGGTPGCVMRSDILRLELLARFGGIYLDTDVKPIRPLDDMCPPEVRAWAACEQLDIVSNAAMGFPPNHPAMWHAVAMIEESFFERRYVGDQAGPGLIARVITQYDDVALYPPAYFHPTVGESKCNPDAMGFLRAAHLFAGTWVEANQTKYAAQWTANAAGCGGNTALPPTCLQPVPPMRTLCSQPKSNPDGQSVWRDEADGVQPAPRPIPDVLQPV